MAKEKPIQVITPPNALKAKIGGPLPALDKNAIARAEAALAQLSDQFGEWILEELARLTEAWAGYEARGGDAASTAELHRRAHDLKGLAPTYGYPLVGRICNTLCKLTGEDVGADKPPMSLLRAHVDAVKAAVKGRIMANDHPVGVALAAELEAQMKKFVQKPSAA
jgi:HPt (histidine-containing phosphotransfer) domain-containing protein